MLIEVLDFKREHMEQLLSLPINQRLVSIFKEPNYEVLERPKLSYTIVCAETKRVLFVGGIIPFWQGRGECWAMFNENVEKYMLQITRAVRRYFELSPYTRIESTVELGFNHGHRWNKLLGLKLEAPIMEKYWPDGTDCSLYSRVK